MKSGHPRFDDFRSITARFDSTGKCGHPIKKGDTIGYSRRWQQAHCAECWQRWSAENAEADAVEQGYMNSPL